jgi:putative DNA primase/helicase
VREPSVLQQQARGEPAALNHGFATVVQDEQIDLSGRSLKERRIVPSFSDPPAVVRALLNALYKTPEGFRLRHHRGQAYIWDGTCWSAIARRDVRSLVYHHVENAWYVDERRGLLPWNPTSRKVDDVLDALESLTLIGSRLEAPFWIDGRPDDPPAKEIIAMRNGLLHVPTRTLRAPSPRLFACHALPFDYLPDAPRPTRWLAFLSELWPQDESSIRVLQETIGYLLAGETNLQKIFLVVGPKRGGKGTIGRVLAGLMGPHNVAAPTLSSLSTNFGLAPLIDKPLAIVADARLSVKTESHSVVERLLSISGEDSLTVDRKYRDHWTGRLPTRFLILTNELPRLSDVSGALASRFVVFALTKSFYGAENPRLTSELVAEAPSIFMWALSGLDGLLTRGYFEQPESSGEAIQRLDDLASPVGAFLRARCVIAADARVCSDDLWGAWKLWCAAENRLAGNRALFGRDLQATVPTIRHVRGRQGDERRYEYVGIGISNNGAAVSTTLDLLDPALS